MNAEAKALQQWMAENTKLADPATIGAPAGNRQYLENRLRDAFLGGMKAQEKIATARLTKALSRIMRDV